MWRVPVILVLAVAAGMWVSREPLPQRQIDAAARWVAQLISPSDIVCITIRKADVP